MARGVRQRFAARSLNYHALRLLGGRLPRLSRGWMPWLGMDRYARPALPGPDWVRLRPLLAGICGTDLALLTGRASAILSPFASFPAVLGHEVVAVVEEGGQRVVVDPLLGCVPRGLEPCRWCAAGRPGLCLRTAEGPFSPAPMLGYCADLPGGWSDEIVAHRSQLHPVPDALSDEAAVLVEPLSVALHAVFEDPPAGGTPVLVIGAGSLGLCTLAALRLAAPDARVIVVARHAFQRTMAARLEAAAVVESALSAAAEHAGAQRHRSIAGEEVLIGGFDRVYDAVGTRRSIDAAIRVAGPRASVSVLGGPAHLGGLDWTLVWARELRIVGSYVYGREPRLAEAPHTFDAAMRLLTQRPDLPIGELVTHRYPLRQWRRAMATALGRGRSGAIKVAFEPQASASR
jgi:threonine dehydrogenase-like Zn-dependent dehydrogenase